MRSLVVVRILVVVGLIAAGLTGISGTASAAPPQWSGMDARAYNGPIPGSGGLIETVPLDPALSVPGAAAAYRILYATIDQHDRPAVATAAVFVPRTPAPQGGWPVVAWAHGTVGLGDDCTPSARPRSDRDGEYLSHWLDQGYAVVAADYTGLGTPGLMSYLNSVASARSVTDAVVAAHQMDLPLSPEWAVVGQSQGGAAAVATARWASEFSAGSGLEYRGVVATGTPATVESIIKQAGPDMAVPPELGPVANAYAAYIVAALREARPDLNLDSVLSAAGRAAADEAETMCLSELSEKLSDATVPGLFSAPIASIPGAVEAIDDYMGIPADGYDQPIFLGVGLRDRDVPPSLTLRFNDQLLVNGQQVTLKVYPDEDHSGTVLASLPDSTPFLAQQLR
ncbi:alpha/beta hydrolase family protein [Mycolicibacterium vaccae]|uniref:alpha/beta hydrolase family protein n=1 Tax=Mycolicibacterium vaccae TaxID=1810 RepID=UPI003CF2C565